jgi:hypothetical protein
MSRPNRWRISFKPEHRARPDPSWRKGHTLDQASILDGTDAEIEFADWYFRLQQPVIERLDSWEPTPKGEYASWESNNISRAKRCSTGFSHYVALCDRFDSRNGLEPSGPFTGLEPLPSAREANASGGRLLFDARQATAPACMSLSFNAQRLLLPLLGHPLVETAFRADPFTWSRVARFLVIAAVREAKRIFEPNLVGVAREDYDEFYRKHWPYPLEPYLYDVNPVAPADPTEFFRFMTDAMNAGSRARRGSPSM